MPHDGAAERTPAREAAAAACVAAGLGPLLDATREKARTRVIRMYDRNMYQPTWAGLNWGRSLGTVEDRVAVAAAVEDAAIGTVAADVATADEVETLLEPMRLLAAMHPDETPRSEFAGTRWTARVGAVLFLHRSWRSRSRCSAPSSDRRLGRRAGHRGRGRDRHPARPIDDLSEIVVQPATPDRWADVAAIFEGDGGQGLLVPVLAPVERRLQPRRSGLRRATSSTRR